MYRLNYLLIVFNIIIITRNMLKNKFMFVNMKIRLYNIFYIIYLKHRELPLNVSLILFNIYIKKIIWFKPLILIFEYKIYSQYIIIPYKYSVYHTIIGNT